MKPILSNNKNNSLSALVYLIVLLLLYLLLALHLPPPSAEHMLLHPFLPLFLLYSERIFSERNEGVNQSFIIVYQLVNLAQHCSLLSYLIQDMKLLLGVVDNYFGAIKQIQAFFAFEFGILYQNDDLFEIKNISIYHLLSTSLNRTCIKITGWIVV